MSYKEELKSPRWQKKRLKIFERDGFTCCHCGDRDQPLHVHHRHYRRNEDGSLVAAWDYPDEDLVTLCEHCHKTEEAMIKVLNHTTIYNLRACCRNTDAIIGLNILIRDMFEALNRRLTEHDFAKLYQIIADIKQDS